MDNFIEALYGQPEGTIPEEYDWFAPLLGDWEFDYKDKFIDGDHNRPQRQLKGEWIFRRVLNGIGIEDMFICPSRATRETSPQPDGEYGVGLRIYNSKTHCYDMVYACKSKFTNLCFTMENGILTGLHFLDTGQNGVVAYTLGDYANGDLWKEMKIHFIGRILPFRRMVTLL